jgi:hypothetical protein
MPNLNDKFTITYAQLKEVLCECGSFYDDDSTPDRDTDEEIDAIIDMVYEMQLRS